MPTRTVHPPRHRKKPAHAPPPVEEAPAAKRLGKHLVGMGLVLSAALALPLLLLGAQIPLLGLLTVLSALFLVTILDSGVRLWRGVVPTGRLASLLAGSGALWLGVIMGLLLVWWGRFPGWQASYAQDYATSMVPLLLGGMLVLLVGGWTSQAIDAASRLRRALMAYSGAAALAALLLAALFSSPGMLLGLAAHLAVLGWSWRLRETTEQVRDQGLESRW